MNDIRHPTVYPSLTVSSLASPRFHLTKLNMAEHQARLYGAASRRICICDTGITQSHSEFKGRIVAARSFVGRNWGEPDDQNGHGTAVASLAVGATNGMANQAEILAAKVLGDDGGGSSRDVAEGIRWGVDEGANVINLSLGGPFDDSHTRLAIDYAKSHDVMVVGATGNDNADGVSFPAANCAAVGSVNSSYDLSWFSNRGAAVDLVAFGENVVVATPGSWEVWSGTSFSTPIVAGIALLMQAAELIYWEEVRTKNDASLLQVETLVHDLGPAGRDSSYGRGFPDVQRLLYDRFHDTPDPPQPTPIDTLDDDVPVSVTMANGTVFLCVKQSESWSGT